MEQSNSAAYIYNSHTEAEGAIRSLSKAGFDIKKLSLIGKGCHSEEQAIGFYTVGERIKSWGTRGAFWGGIWRMLFAPAVFVLPGLGLVAMAGPVVTILVNALEGAVIVGGVSALGAALAQVGVPDNQVIKFETALKVDKYILMVHGNAEEVSQARSILSDTVATA